MIKNMSQITKIGLLVVLFAGSIAYAESLSPTSVKQVRATATSTGQVREEVRNEVRQMVASTTDKIKELRDERKVQMEQKLQEIKNRYQEQRQTRVAAYMEKMINRFNAAATRLETLANRLDSHLTNLETRKVDTIEARALLVTAKTKIQVAKDSIILIQPTADSALQSIDMKATFEGVRQIIDEAKTALKVAHAALVEVIQVLKPGLNKTATTTPS